MVTNDLPKVGSFMQILSIIILLSTTPLPHGRLTSTGTSQNICGVQNNKKWTFQRHKDFTKLAYNKMTQLNQLWDKAE